MMTAIDQDDKIEVPGQISAEHTPNTQTILKVRFQRLKYSTDIKTVVTSGTSYNSAYRNTQSNPGVSETVDFNLRLTAGGQ